MKRLVFLIMLVVTLFLSACGASSGGPLGKDAVPGNIPNLVGEYAVNGFDPAAQEYGGRLTITAGKNPGEYHLQWIVTGGIQEGDGVVEGNQLRVKWTAIAGAKDKVQGTALYTVTVNGELYGSRMIDGAKEVGTETAYPNKK